MHRMSSLGQPRQSTIASGQASSNAQQRYVDKKAEYEGVTALNAASELMASPPTTKSYLSIDPPTIAIGSVLANWPNVWRIIGLTATAGQSQAQGGTAEGDEAGVETVPRLVRIEVNKPDGNPAPES
ncbi:DASH complex subunit Dad2 [Ceratobasidium sp. AG-Ba]|nr:DASH complex subunit Dad2 [Ceratobasidium sp. AG-Ba]